MCYQLVEVYTICKCLYYQHAIDRCVSYGRPGHKVSQRTILVGYSCQHHGARGPARPSKPPQSLNQVIERSRREFHEPDTSEDLNAPDLGVVASQSNPSRAPEIIEHEDTQSDDSSSYVSSVVELASSCDQVGESSVTSLSTLGSLNALDSIANGLIYDSELQFLFPQLILKSQYMAQSQEQISHLILRYSADLQVLAKNTSDNPSELASRKLSVANFIQRRRKRLAQEICRYYWRPELDADEAYLEKAPTHRLGPEKTLEEKEDSGDDDQFEVNTITSVKEFLFGTEPFYYFRDNVRAYVEQNPVLPLHIRYIDFARKSLNDLLFNLQTPPLKPGNERLYWTCTCGWKLYDDYTEIRRGALDDLKGMLSSYGVRSRVSGDLEANAPQRPLAGSSTNSDTRKSRYFDIRLVPHWRHRNSIEPGKCPKLATNAENSHNYILACMPFGRWVSKLHQAEVCTINSDQDFFSLLRLLHYGSKKISRPLSWFFRVKAIHFVQLEMFRDAISDIRTSPAVPPEDRRGEYFYDPMPADLIPPIGPNILVHMFENPNHAGVLPDLYKKVPKKLREKLVPCQEKGTAMGWGIQFVEGIDTLKFFICGCAGFLLCLLAAITWTILRDDVQGGFGIGGFLLAFMVFCGGILHTSTGA